MYPARTSPPVLPLLLAAAVLFAAPYASRAQDPGEGYGSERVRLYHVRQAVALAELLRDLMGHNPAGSLKGLQVTVPAYVAPSGKAVKVGAPAAKPAEGGGDEEKDKPAEPVTAPGGNNDELILSGPFAARRAAKQIMASLDLPQPGVTMEMWAIQISSSQPDKMARVLQGSQADIVNARAGVQGALKQMQSLAASLNHDSKFDEVFSALGYESALEKTRTFSLTDILLRLAAAEGVEGKTESNPVARFANELTAWLHGNYPEFANALASAPGSRVRRPFESLFASRGLTYDKGKWVPDGRKVEGTAYAARAAVLRFAYHYGDMLHRPERFSAYYVQQTAGSVNDRLQLAVHALNHDIYELFIAPTLEKIRRRTKGFSGVEYAQVGRTSVATLSGTKTVVSGKATSPFDETQPMRLSELLTKASALETQIGSFIPNIPVTPAKPKKKKPADMGGMPPATPPAGTTPPAAPPAEEPEEKPDAPTSVAPTIGGIYPYTKLIGLIAAFGEDRTMWRELNSGVSLDITPIVLRNAASAELNIDLTIGDPLVTSAEKSAEGAKAEQKIPPLARITEHKVKSRIEINSLDLFDLSTFSSQVTRGGGRGYVPLLGGVWRGIFGDVPVLGDLFSWPKPPRSVYHQSILLVGSVITPTAMSVAVLLPTDLTAAATVTYLKDPDLTTLNTRIGELEQDPKSLAPGEPSLGDQYRKYFARAMPLLRPKVDEYIKGLNDKLAR